MPLMPSNQHELTVRRRFAACFFLLSLLLLLIPVRAKAQSNDGAQVYLPLIAAGAGQDGNNQQQTSLQLIDAAVTAGQLTYEQGLLYRVQAVMGDDALPATYRGQERGLDGSLVMAEAITKLDTLTPALQAHLRPYLLPPSVAGSWLASRAVIAAASNTSQAAWDTVTTANGKVKVWYHPETASHGARAVAVANAINNKIWPQLVQLLREPLPDCGAACPLGGGAPSIDIYIVNTGRAYMQPFTCCNGASGFAVIRPDTSFAQITRLFAQIIEFGYPMAALDEYRWLLASTAQYAMHYVYPSSNEDPDYPARHEEHRQAGDFLHRQSWPLETVDDRHERGAYLLFYYIDDPSTIADVWSNATMADSLANVNNQLFGGFRQQWPQFAVENWNRPPVDGYRQHDELTVAPDPVDEFVIERPGVDDFIVDVEHLTAYYLRFRFPKRALKRIAFFNPIAGAGDPDVALWAIMKIDGTWRTPQEWTKLSHQIFCRDEPDQNLEEVILVISDSNWQDRSHALRTDNGSVHTSADCGGQLSGTLTWHSAENVELPSGAKTTYERTTIINVKLRYDVEAEEYVDDGSTYSHNGTYYSEGRDQQGKLGYITKWEERGSGNFSADGKYIRGSVALNETTADEVWIGASIKLRKVGTTTYYPAGQIVPFDGEESHNPRCNDPTGLRGLRNENGVFDMSCQTDTGVNVSGSLTVP